LAAKERRKGTWSSAATRIVLAKDARRAVAVNIENGVCRVAVVSELSSELELKSLQGRDSVVVVTQL
jgi:hypothetical protein